MTDMNDIREQLTESVNDGLYDLDKEETLRQMIAETFRGKTRWMSVVIWVESILFTVLIVWSGVAFFGAETTRDQILYATCFLTCGLIILLIKVWFWMLIHRNSVRREVKRLELRVAELIDVLEHRES